MPKDSAIQIQALLAQAEALGASGKAEDALPTLSSGGALIDKGLANEGSRVWQSLATLLSRLGRHAEAVEAGGKAVGWAQKSADDVRTADCRMTLGNALTRAGEYAAAEATLVEAVRLYAEALDDAPSGEGALDHARASMNAAVLFRRRGRPEEAKAWLLGALERLPEGAEAAQSLLAFRLCANLAACAHDLGLYAEGIRWCERAETYLRPIEGLPLPNLDLHAHELARNLAILQSLVGDPLAARKGLERAVAVYRRQAEEEPARYAQPLAQTLLNLANLLRKQGESARAETTAVECLRLLEADPAARGSDACQDWLLAARVLLRARIDQGSPEL